MYIVTLPHVTSFDVERIIHTCTHIKVSADMELYLYHTKKSVMWKCNEGACCT